MVLDWRLAAQLPEQRAETFQVPEPDLACNRPRTEPLAEPCETLSPTVPSDPTRPAMRVAASAAETRRTWPSCTATEYVRRPSHRPLSVTSSTVHVPL